MPEPSRVLVKNIQNLCCRFRLAMIAQCTLHQRPCKHIGLNNWWFELNNITLAHVANNVVINNINAPSVSNMSGMCCSL